MRVKRKSSHNFSQFCNLPQVKRRSRARTDSRPRTASEVKAEPEELDFQFEDGDEVFPGSRRTFSRNVANVNNADEDWYIFFVFVSMSLNSRKT